MRKARIVFIGTSIWELTSQHLDYFLRHDANIVAYVESPLDNISTTVSKESSYKNIHDVAIEMQKPLFCPKNPRDPEFLNIMKDINPDVIIVCGYQFYLPEQLLKIPAQGAINFHTSLLPRHCGMHPGFQTIWYGDKESGMTIHFMDTGLDTGDIIYQNKVPVLPGDTVDTLYERIWNSCEPLVKQLLDDLDSDTLPRTPQDPAHYFYNYEIDEHDFELDFRQTAELLRNRVEMMPGKFYFICQDQKYYVNECSIIKEPVLTRKFRLRVPYIFKDELIFVTPRGFLQVDKIMKDDGEVVPLSSIEANTLRTIG